MYRNTLRSVCVALLLFVLYECWRCRKLTTRLYREEKGESYEKVCHGPG